MAAQLHDLLLWIHIPFGALSLILFWLPVGLPKGSPKHRTYGLYYFYCMWVVVVTALLLSICNLILNHYMAALYLGYLSIITAYPLWYSHEILKQGGEWSNRYFIVRKIFLAVLFASGIGMILMGGLKYHFLGMGTMMGFFGLLALPSGRDLFRRKAIAIQKEQRLKMHIQGTIISGIAAYTAFAAFGGSRILVGLLHFHHQWMVIPWILPTVLGIVYSRYMKRKYRAV
jgi:hypothetical protein